MIREKSCAKKISQGAFVREALLHYAGCASDENSFNFMKVTQEMLKGKLKKKTTTIDEIRAILAKQPQPDMSPEEEVRRSRTRGLL
jgi:hypothetical protein